MFEQEYRKEAQDILSCITILENTSNDELHKIKIDKNYNHFYSLYPEDEGNELLYSNSQSYKCGLYKHNIYNKFDLFYNEEYYGAESGIVVGLPKENHNITYCVLNESNKTEEEYFQNSLNDDNYIIDKGIVYFKEFLLHKDQLSKSGFYLYLSLYDKFKNDILGLKK